uniref:Uncharacterized protein n=1 Tax=Myotis myotis TaxID=51298 RepID=A0A7J7SCC7_MYOMY|nr:hypothetical protein mMyoMyo1_009558 [Myotis myotis]
MGGEGPSVRGSRPAAPSRLPPGHVDPHVAARQPHAQGVGAARVPGGGGGNVQLTVQQEAEAPPFAITKGPSGVSPAVLGLSCVTSYGSEGTASAGQGLPSRDESAEEPGEDRPRGSDSPAQAGRTRSRRTVSAGFVSLHSAY